MLFSLSPYFKNINPTDHSFSKGAKFSEKLKLTFVCVSEGNKC